MISIFRRPNHQQINILNSNEPVAENWHENFILYLASLLKPKLYVELGLYHCELFNKIVPYADKLIGVDISKDSKEYMIKSPKTRFICSQTDKAAILLKKSPKKIDLLFIDADHSYKSVKTDFSTYFPLMADQGIILLHDGYPKNKEYSKKGYCGDGYKAIWELVQKRKDYEMVTIPIHPGITICRKRNKQVQWL